MPNVRLFLLIFWLFVLLLIGSAVQNVIKGHELLSLQEFVMAGILVFLVLGDEYIKFRVREGETERDKGDS